MKKYVFLFGAALSLAMLAGHRAYAAGSSQFKVDVYPLNCVFEYIDVGSRQIMYLTPRECGQHTEPPVNVGGHGEPQKDSKPVQGSDLQGGASVSQPESSALQNLDGTNSEPLVPGNGVDTPNQKPHDAILPAAGRSSWVKPAIIGGIVMSVAVGFDAGFGFVGSKLAANAAYHGAGRVRRLGRLVRGRLR